MNIVVCALDPGRMTGYALGLKDDEHFYIAYDQAEFSHLALYQFLLNLDFNRLSVICESFEFRHGKQLGVDLYPCELIGVVKLALDRNSSDSYQTKLHMQTAAQGKSYFGDEKLKTLEIYKRGVEHGRDACRHLLQWCYFGAGFKYFHYLKVIQPELVDEEWLRQKMQRG